MFTFFGLLADPINNLPPQISEVWPELKLIRLQSPISAIAGRFGEDHDEPSREDIPEGVLSCWGGVCANWGQVIQDGRIVFQAEGDGALRRLIGYWGVDIGPREIFEPLCRSFDWGQDSLA